MHMTTKELTRPATTKSAEQQTLPAATRFGAFDAIQQEIDRVFDRFNGFNSWPAMFRDSSSGAFQAGFSPNMEVTETDNAIEVSTELPGLDEKDVEISVTDGMLTIRGEKKFEKDEKKKNYRLVERSYGSFERAVALPAGVDAAKVKAKITKGVLKVEIPKPAAAKAQQVKIATE
jgi:HSP20 family protein